MMTSLPLSFLYLISSILSVKFISNAQQISLSCNNGEFFDDVALNCSSCPPNRTSTYGINECKCNLGFIELNQECVACAAQHVSSFNGQVCVKCPTDAPFNEELNQCEKCKDDSILIDRVLNGTQLQEMKCISCSNNTMADKDNNRCVPCHSSFLTENDCHCDSDSIVLDGQCIKLSELSDIPDRESSYLVHFKYGSIKSSFFREFYRSAAHGCKFNNNRTACHLLANLCTLLHFSFDNELNACSFYRTYFGKNSVDLPDHVPWLYYDVGKAPKILSDDDITAIYSFKKSNRNHFLNFTVAKYSYDGRLISFGSIEDNLDLCPLLKIYLQNILQFGVTSDVKCNLNADSIWNEYISYFYEIYLHYWDDKTNSIKYYPVPILNKNYELENSPVNYYSSRRNWQLVRRFFVFDNISGKEHNSYSNSKKATVVRYLQSIDIKVTKKAGPEDGLIYPPLLILSFGELNYESPALTKSVSIKVEYSMDHTDSKRDVSITIGVMSMFAVFWSLIETYSWGKRSGKVGIDLSGLVRLILILCGNLANIFFLVQFCACFYWTLIFKKQDVAFMFLPINAEEFVVKQYIISAFALKFVHLCYILYEQMTVDLFLIDWEKPRAKNTIPHPQLSKKKKNEISDLKQDDNVSIWRIYFVANEWNEIQTLRKTNLAFQFIGLLFILKVLNFEDYASYDPNSNSDSGSTVQSPYSYVCRFAISISMYLILTSIQLVFRSGFYERYVEHKLQQFVDLCSMANISVFILQQPLYGYYIHGRSVHGFADSDMKTFYENLRREEEDLCAYRGLEASSDCQTFEVITTYKFRDEYLGILNLTNDQSGASQQHHSRRSKINAWKVEQTVKSHERMKTFFEMFLQHSSTEVDYVIKDKLFLENILDVEFQNVDDKCLLFRDANYLFNRVLFYGQETLLLTFEMILFSFVDLFSYNYILAAIVTYIVSYVIKIIRNSGGKRNLVKKTLVDQRFLI